MILHKGQSLPNFTAEKSAKWFSSTLNLPSLMAGDMMLCVGGTLRNLSSTKRIRYLLILTIIITLPCYFLGLVVLRINRNQPQEISPTVTLTSTRTATVTLTPIVSLTPTITATVTQTNTVTQTSTNTTTATPSSTLTVTLTPTETMTQTLIPPTETVPVTSTPSPTITTTVSGNP